jgi:hypothetical protein
VPLVPEGSVDEAITNGCAGAGATTIEVDADAVCAGLPESVTVTEKLTVPAVVGVPEITPDDAESERPFGNLPDVTDHV